MHKVPHCPGVDLRELVAKKGHPHLTDALTVLQVRAYSEDNKYKEGKFILEKKLLTDVK